LHTICTSLPVHHHALLDDETTKSGDLRVELQGRLECNVRLENSYLVNIKADLMFSTDIVQVDASRDMIKWSRDQGMSLIDVNVFSQPATGPTVGLSERKSLPTSTGLTLIYIARVFYNDEECADIPLG
jgi:hypothetical protein